MKTRPIVEADALVKDIKACNNSDYFMIYLNLPQEVFGKVFSIEEQPNPVSTTILCESERDKHLYNLKKGSKYRFIFALDIQKGNSKDGKSYPDSIGFNVLGAKLLQ
ncbi:MAG: hypothetical protein AB4372_06420 [Xenococcus sp. (in: cyanobacteria)]